jgi:hypothetical protein
MEWQMRGELKKAEIEFKVFYEFAELTSLSFAYERKGNPDLGEPDIFCLVNNEPTYFELAEACSPEIAAAISKAVKTEESIYVRGNDTSEKTLRKKLKKEYSVLEPVELLLYSGRTTLPDDVVIAKLEPIIFSNLGQFRKIWFLGEKANLIASSS